MAKLFANSGDPDQMPHSVVTDLGLHCLPITLVWVQDKYGTELWCQNLLGKYRNMADELLGE